jgi:glycosyltransferase involved in cell wall biosynthesis
MDAKKVLFIGMVWPEPTSSAAGTRILQLVNLFLANGDEVHFASAASLGEFSFDLKSINVIAHAIELNNISFNHFISALQPNIIVFDRYVTEEQFGWRALQECPNALRLLDTEDLHFLRSARQTAIKKGEPENLYNEVTKREIASILRCDLSLIISEKEMDILENQFHLPSSVLHYIPFLEEEITETQIANWPTFEDRTGFVFIGNFLHEPNWQTVLVLKNEVWPILRKLMPTASLNIYGAYPSQKVMQLHNKAERLFVHGRADDAKKTISKHRILIAPIKFGAGAKGKFIDGMLTGTPSITTTIGAESMHGDLPWCGLIEDDLEAFCDKAKQLYEIKNSWQQTQQNGVEIINQRFSKHQFASDFLHKVEELTSHLNHHRQQNFFGQLLNHHTLQSTKYMSMWIEEKNK